MIHVLSKTFNYPSPQQFDSDLVAQPTHLTSSKPSNPFDTSPGPGHLFPWSRKIWGMPAMTQIAQIFSKDLTYRKLSKEDLEKVDLVWDKIASCDELGGFMLDVR